MYRNVAYAFKSELSLEELFESLNRGARDWEWLRRENDRHGDYLSALVIPEWGMLKLYPDEDRYVLDVVFKSKLPDALAEPGYERLVEIVEKQVLPITHARDIESVEGWGS